MEGGRPPFKSIWASLPLPPHTTSNSLQCRRDMPSWKSPQRRRIQQQPRTKNFNGPSFRERASPTDPTTCANLPPTRGGKTNSPYGGIITSCRWSWRGIPMAETKPRIGQQDTHSHVRQVPKRRRRRGHPIRDRRSLVRIQRRPRAVGTFPCLPPHMRRVVPRQMRQRGADAHNGGHGRRSARRGDARCE